MHRARVYLIICAALCTLALCLPLPAAAVSSITLSQSGENQFLLQGNGIENAAGMEFNISYNSASMHNPRVTEGPLIAGAMTAFNPNVPGSVRMVIISLTPIRGSGVIATLTFDRIGSSPGDINFLSVQLADIRGKQLPVSARISEPPAPPDAASDSAPGRSEQGMTAQPAGPVSTDPPLPLPTAVIIAGRQPPLEEERERSDHPQPVDRNDVPAAPATDEHPAASPPTAMHEGPGEVPAKKSALPDTAGEKQLYAHTSILDRFRGYRGERTLPALVALFREELMFGIRQDPPIAFSDGRSTVKVTFLSPPGDRTPSDIAVLGARLLSLKKDPDNTNTWIAELALQKGTCQASMAVSQGDVEMVYPLTVAPRIEPLSSRVEGLSENDFLRYLSYRAAEASPAVDFNQDATRDYVDDFIFTANYLDAVDAKRRAAREPMTGMTGQGIR